MPDYWWEGDGTEHYWLESTDREDLGTDLRAPLADGADKENWRYSLFRQARPDDIVFHYDKRARAITSVSRIAGDAFEAPITWAARGSYARERGAVPTEVPGYRMPLADYRLLDQPVSLDVIRAARAELGDLYAALPPGSRYFPFELSDRPVRPLQGYAFKLPASFVALFGLAATVPLTSVLTAELTETDIFRDALAAIEAAAKGYAIAGLQQLRARNRGLRRVGRTIFGNRQLAESWAFHWGGRDELQFNVGLDYFPDGTRAFRAGVAFSFEPSRSLPDIEVLVPKVARFNAYLRDQPDPYCPIAWCPWTIVCRGCSRKTTQRERLHHSRRRQSRRDRKGGKRQYSQGRGLIGG